MLLAKTGRRISKPRAVQFFVEPIQWADDARYLGVILNKGLTWLKHIDQVKNKEAKGQGTLGPLLNRRSGLSIRNGVLLYKQFIRPMMDYACPVWRSAARSHIKKLLVLQSKCLCIANNVPWYVGNREIHDLGVPYFSEQIRSLTERFDSNLADVRNSIFAQLGSYFRWPRVDLRPLPWGKENHFYSGALTEVFRAFPQL